MFSAAKCGEELGTIRQKSLECSWRMMSVFVSCSLYRADGEAKKCEEMFAMKVRLEMPLPARAFSKDHSL